MVEYLILPLAYFIGGLPFGFWIGKFFCKVDVRTMGSGNIGAANVIRNLGVGWGALVLILDLFKSFLPLFLIKAYFSNPLFLSIFAILLVVGHNYSPFLKFRGGKGVATTMGVYFALAFPATLWIVLTYLTTFLITGFSSVASLTTLLLTPLILWLMNFPNYLIYLSIILFLMALTRHKDNIIRLLKREEKPLFPTKRS